MTNAYYNPSGAPTSRGPGSSVTMRAELAAIAAGFALLPALSGNASKLVIINAAGTALDVTTSPTMTAPVLGVATGTSFNGITALSSTSPANAGVAAVGVSATVARSDHVHLAQTATTVVNTPAGNISAVTVQAALNELDAEKALLAGSASQAFSVSTLSAAGAVTISGAFALRGSYGGGGDADSFAAGDGALAANSVGYNNTAVGVNALTTNSVGNYNTAVGAGALANNTASYNTAIGAGALSFNTTGSDNTASGYNALLSNTTGISNTAYGKGALQSNTTASNNTAVGVNALINNTTGSENTASGYRALFSVTTGAYNVASGSSALASNTTGNSNSAHGKDALGSSTTGGSNSASGTSSLRYNTTGSYNSALGSNALLNNTTGSGNTAVNSRNSAGTYAPVFDPTTENDRFCMGSTGVTNAYIQVAWTVVSDARDKTDFAAVPHGLDFVSKLKPTAYRYKMDREDTEGHGPVRYGFKAQDVLALEGATPVIVDAEDLDKLRFNDQSMIAVLVNALQELNAKFEAYVSAHP